MVSPHHLLLVLLGLTDNQPASLFYSFTSKPNFLNKSREDSIGRVHKLVPRNWAGRIAALPRFGRSEAWRCCCVGCCCSGAAPRSSRWSAAWGPSWRPWPCGAPEAQSQGETWIASCNEIVFEVQLVGGGMASFWILLEGKRQGSQKATTYTDTLSIVRCIIVNMILSYVIYAHAHIYIYMYIYICT